jgi:hypothetical protein
VSDGCLGNRRGPPLEQFIRLLNIAKLSETQDLRSAFQQLFLIGVPRGVFMSPDEFRHNAARCLAVAELIPEGQTGGA